MLKRLLILFFIISIYQVAFAQSIYKKFTPQQMQEDLDTMVKFLEDTHPNPYYRYSKAQFHKDVQSVKNNIHQDLTLLDFYFLAEQLLAKLDDGHTDFHIVEDYDEINPIVLPYTFKLSDKAPYLICQGPYASFKTKIPRDAAIISINDIPAQKIVNDVINLNTGENRAFRADYGSSRFYFYLEALYKANGTYKIKYAHQSTTKTVTVKGVRQQDVEKGKTTSSVNTVNNYSLTILDKEKTAIIAFKNFDWEGYTTFADSAFTLIKQKGIQHLVINLIDNGGGDSDVGDDLLQYLLNQPFKQYEKVYVKNSILLKERLKVHRKDKPLDSADLAILNKPNGIIDTIQYADIPIKPNSLRFDGDVYLLVNLQTYSSAADFAQCFKHYHRGMIIGEETGGLIKSYGDIVPVQLPHTRLDMTISSALYDNIGAEENDWHGVVPDIAVPANRALQQTMDIIRRKGNTSSY
ncbi:C-terminal processing protease CtpA/Prc [Chitinophaga dinghuensis]|uniref:C-terminal processing protease CtpA/Prc n=1 Tax=Chitinophaga dinghuensis TaxID=1539050 RepID=A0A327VYE4_9BACT|nr:S41 family peptidase [Chitinophaga dinghuensis]RAJ80373.1 C-terminal processing protease CtpA/Prc [Chitinophaga dinghuensis]